METQKYRFFDENREHLHQLFSERKGEYENLTGTTTIIEVLGKPLTWWASGMAVGKLGWLNSKLYTSEERLEKAELWREKIWTMTPTDFLKLLDEAYKAHNEYKNEKAEEGTDLHAELEEYVKTCIQKYQGKPLLEKPLERDVWEFIKWADKNIKRFLWSELYCYDEMLFVGGISDAGAELKDGSYAILDFKSSKEAYFSHFVQIGGYDLQISKNGGFTKDGEKIFNLEKSISQYIVFPFGVIGIKELKPNIQTNVEGFKRSFKSAVQLYREKCFFEKI